MPSTPDVIDPIVKPQHGYWIHRERPFAILFHKLGNKFWERFVEPSNIGLLPKEYNKNVHGPYVPYRYYGKPDTPFKDVKLGEFMAWFRRRNKRPTAIMHAMSRQVHFWVNQFAGARFNNAAAIWQVCLVFATISYIARYGPLHSIHTKSRYH